MSEERRIHIEGVTAESYEHGIQHLYDFGNRKGMAGYNYAFLMLEEDGSHTIVERLLMPCWGAMREYGCGTRPDDYWPNDLREPHHIFPKTGNPVAISFQFNSVYQNRAGWNTVEEWNRFMAEFVMNTDISPWRSVLKDFEPITDGNLITGILIKDTKVDPTVIANMMKYVGRAARSYPRLWCREVDKGYHPLTAALYGFRNSFPRIVPERFFNGQPFDYTEGTFYDRYSYNRPDVEKIFGGKNNIGTIINTMSIKDIDDLRIAVEEKANAA